MFFVKKLLSLTLLSAFTLIISSKTSRAVQERVLKKWVKMKSNYVFFTANNSSTKNATTIVSNSAWHKKIWNQFCNKKNKAERLLKFKVVVNLLYFDKHWENSMQHNVFWYHSFNRITEQTQFLRKNQMVPIGWL